MPGAAVDRYAPMPAQTVTRRPRIVPSLRGRHLDLLHVIAAVRRRLIVLAARLGPLHGTAELHRAERGDELARILRDLAAEAAADFGRDTRSLSSGTPVTTDVAKRRMCGFCVVFQIVSSPVARHPLRDRRARLHRGRNQPLLDDPLVHHDHAGRRERGIDVAARHRPVKGPVVRDVRMQLRRARRAAPCGIDDAGSGS